MAFSSISLSYLRQFHRCYSVMHTKPYDIVIVGGGMVGFGLAAVASRSPFLRKKRILLLESSSPITYKLQEERDARVVALNVASQKMLEDVGAWDYIKSKRVQPVKLMKVWETKSDACLTFRRDPLAFLVENALVSEALRLSTQYGHCDLNFAYQTRADKIEIPTEEHPDRLLKVHIKHGQETKVVETRLLVGADGVQSRIREMADIHQLTWNHDQSAIVATLRMGENNEENTAWQRFLPTGPIAILPLSNDLSSLTWSTTNNEADRLMAMPVEDFVKEINAALSQPSVPSGMVTRSLTRVGRSLTSLVTCSTQSDIPQEAAITPPVVVGLQSASTRRMRFPLGFQHATFYHASRLALVGDAAHRILPLAGQGVNAGFGDVISLVKHIEAAVSEGADIGSENYLREYTTERQRFIIPLAMTMEALNLLYSAEAFLSHGPLSESLATVLATMRSAGLNTVQTNAPIKNMLLQTAITGQLSLGS